MLNGPWTFVVVLVVGTLVRVPQLNDSLNEVHAFRQAQTAMTAREFARHGIDLLSSPLTVFGAHGNAPMEFPLFQAFAALLMNLGIDVTVASRLAGLVCFQASAVLLALLVARLHGRWVAFAALVLFEFLPFGMQWGSASLIEFMAVAFALGMVVGLQRWLTAGSIVGLVAGSVSAILAFLVKPTTAPAWVVLALALCWLVIANAPSSTVAWRRSVIGVVLGPILGLVAGLAWTAYADAVKVQEALPAFLTSSMLRSWNFGTLGQRLDPAVYEILTTRIAEVIGGTGLAFLCLGVVSIAARGRLRRRIEWAWIAVSVAPILVFTNLYFQHDYYLSGIYPALVVIAALGIVWVARAVTVRFVNRIAVAASLVLVLGVMTWSSPMTVSYSLSHPVIPPESALIDMHTQPQDRLIMAGCSWDPAILFFADRGGLTIEGAPRLEMWELEDAADYAFLLLCSPDHQASDYLPPGYEARQLDDALYRVIESPR